MKLSLSTQPWEPWTFLLQRTFPVAPYMQSWITYLLLTLCFSLLFLLVWRFFFPGSSLAWLFTSVDASLLLATQPVLFLKRLLSTGVVKRQHLHSSTWCTVFFTLGSLLLAFHKCNMRLDTVPFFSGGDHCKIWLSMALYFGSISISGQLPTYPSPNPTTVYW